MAFLEDKEESAFCYPRLVFRLNRSGREASVRSKAGGGCVFR